MNQDLNLPILQSEQTSLLLFVNYWSAFYVYPDESEYELVNQPKFSEQDLVRLFVWKNGMPLSTLKQQSLDQKILTELEYINRCKQEGKLELTEFLVRFSSLSFVWKSFLLHAILPQQYPIYDQNIHRSFNYIHDEKYAEITNTLPDKEKEQFYFEKYLPFIQHMKGIPQRKIDQAFFAFGQFLNKNNGPFHLMLE